MQFITQSAGHHPLIVRAGRKAFLPGMLFATALAFSLPAAAQTAVEGAAAPSAVATKEAQSPRQFKRGHHAMEGHHGHGMMRHNADEALVVPGYGMLGSKTIEALKLSDAQKKLVEAAQKAQADARTQRIEGMSERAAERKEQLEKGTIDPKKALEAREAERAKWTSQHQEVQDKWLAVWDSFTDEQKKTSADFFSKKADWSAKMRNTPRKGVRHGHKGPQVQ